MVPSVIGTSYSEPVRLSRMVRVAASFAAAAGASVTSAPVTEVRVRHLRKCVHQPIPWPAATLTRPVLTVSRARTYTLSLRLLPRRGRLHGAHGADPDNQPRW